MTQAIIVNNIAKKFGKPGGSFWKQVLTPGENGHKPVGLWVFGMAERYAKRAGKLHRNDWSMQTMRYVS